MTFYYDDFNFIAACPFCEACETKIKQPFILLLMRSASFTKGLVKLM